MPVTTVSIPIARVESLYSPIVAVGRAGRQGRCGLRFARLMAAECSLADRRRRRVTITELSRDEEMLVSAHLDFVIIGAQKGGSTYLARAIGTHPQIWVPRDESPVFRDPIYGENALRTLRASLDEHGDASLRGIKCPDYLARPEVPERLLAAGRPRLVACLRDPVARAVSTYFWHVRWGLLPVEDPSVGLQRVLDGGYRDRDPRVAEILEWGLYGQHLRRYLDFFDTRDLHVMFSHDLRSSPDDEMAALLHFLGADPDVPASPAADPVNEGVYAPWRLRFLNLRNRYILDWGLGNEYVSIGPPVGFRAKAVSWTVAGIDRAVLSRVSRNAKPRLAPEVENRLRGYYADDVRALEVLVGRQLPSWRAAWPEDPAARPTSKRRRDY